MLDFFEINPVSRLPSSNLKSIEAVERDILNHYPIFIPKRAAKEKELPILPQR